MRGPRKKQVNDVLSLLTLRARLGSCRARDTDTILCQPENNDSRRARVVTSSRRKTERRAKKLSPNTPITSTKQQEQNVVSGVRGGGQKPVGGRDNEKRVFT